MQDKKQALEPNAKSGGENRKDKQRLEVLEASAQATKRSGKNILQKAKLQLNRAAINRFTFLLT